jgi:hypothetical protein
MVRYALRAPDYYKQTEIMSDERVFLGEDGQWYFNVRGNQANGPFPSKNDAEQQLLRHVHACRKRVEGGLAWPQDLRPTRLLRRLRPASRPG